jgi:hypothetical protein
MSGYGVSGFGTGFLQGFEAMGRNFAERGVIEAERQKQQREDRRLQMDQELERIREERLAKEAESVSRHRNLQSDRLEAELPLVGDMAKADLEEKKAKTEGERVNTSLLPGKVNAAIEESKASSALHASQAAAQNLKNTEEAQSQAYNKDLSGSLGRMLEGEADDVDVRRASQVLDLAGMENIPEHIKNFHDASIGYVSAVQRGDANADDAFNNEKTLGSINAALKVGIDKNKGLPLDQAGTRVIEGSEVVRLVRNPKDNRLGAVLRVQPAPAPQRRKELEAQLKQATPEQAVQIEKELHPPAYEQMLTDGRTPMALGGKPLWLSPEDVNRMFTDLQGIGEWQARNPKLVQEARTLKAQIDSGQYGNGDSSKALEREIKVRSENRANRREARELTRDEKAQRKEAFNVARRMFEKEYSTGELGMETLTGNAAEKANAAITELDAVLRENPNLTGAQAYNLVKQKVGGNSATQPANPKSGKELSANAKKALSLFEP